MTVIMNKANQFNYCQHILRFVLTLMFSCKIEGKFQFEHLEKHYGSLDRERNRVNFFKYIKLSTEISTEWSAFPTKRKNITFNKHMDEKYSCPVKLEISFLNFDIPNGTICLYQDEVESSLFLPDAKVYIESTGLNAAEFYKDLQAVTGYVMNEVDSVVSGYVINKQFYGTIRLFDMENSYHIIYYLEPIPNLILYNTKENPVYETKSSGPHNAILFEYISHEDENPPGTPLRGKREVPRHKANKSFLKYNSGGEEFNDLDNMHTTLLKNEGKISAKASKKETKSKTRGLKHKSRANNLDKISGKDKTKRYKSLNYYFMKENRSRYDFLPDLFERHVEKRSKVLPSPGQVDTVYFNVENKLSTGVDIIDVLPFSSDSNTEDVFDIRHDHSYQCALCVFIQPNFADKFGYEGGLKTGIAEVLRIISHLNWIFRTIDFNGDGFPEKIGFIVQEIHVTDKIVINPAITPSSKGFVEDIQSIPAASVLKQCSDQFPIIFKESCCAILGFVFHNMAPSMSATNLRGLCSNKNVAIISGFVHAHKISLYDVYREMFHAIGHLFGAPHDNLFDIHCWDTSIYRYLNPFTMHPAPQINVAFRQNAMRYTICSKVEIARFLGSSAAQCLVESKSPYCGNGIMDAGEECDCGNPWQCYSGIPSGGLCCGIRNTVIQCKKIQLTESCPPSYLWAMTFRDNK